MEAGVNDPRPNTELLSRLKTAVAACDSKAAAETTESAVRQGLDPLLIWDAITEVMNEVGERFETGECWLPELVGAAGAVQAAAPILEAEIKRRGVTKVSAGTVVAGTVQGDIHSIGIQMVCTLLTGAGFDVRYLGIDVRPEDFVAAVKEHGASILAMSALLTVTAPEQKRVIDLLKAEGLRDSVKIMVGGGAITGDFATSIGADGYAPSAVGAVELARQFAGA
jgi:5-methyltetrahydrofolate--homocysteine methyltransferase